MTVEQKVILIVVTLNNKIISVYLNGERIAGRKPYASEGCVWQEIEVSKKALLEAIGELKQ
jgi:hypothetical protein